MEDRRPGVAFGSLRLAALHPRLIKSAASPLLLRLESPKVPASNSKSESSNLQSPISNLRSPISNLQFPISNFQSPISNLQFPISNLQSPISNLRSPIPIRIYDFDLQFPIAHLRIVICHFALAAEPRILIAERWSAAEPSEHDPNENADEIEAQ